MTIINKEKILELARLLVEEGKYDRAIREYGKIAAAEPDDMRVKLRIAELYVKRKEIGDAIRVYRQVAEVYSKQGFFLKAVTVCKNILRLNPSLTEVNEELADLYEKMGLMKDAVRQYDLFTATLEHKGELERLMEVRKKIVELVPDDVAARVKLAELYQREGHAEDAIDQYEQLAHQLEMQEGNEDRLIELYEKVLSYRSDRHDMLRRLVRMYYARSDFKKTLKWLEYAKTLTPVDTELLGMQAEIYGRLNQLETARSKYLTLSDLYREQNNTDKAVEVLARIAILVAGEEGRMQQRASEYGAGAKEKFIKAMARLHKSEMEEEAGEAAEKEPPELDRTVIVQLEPEPPKHAAKPETTERQAVKTPPAPPAPKQEPEPVDYGKLRKEARAAYDLALLYKKIGLKDEATKELQRAERLYAQLVDVSPEAGARLSEIQLALGAKAKTLKQVTKPAAIKVPAKKPVVKAPPSKPVPKQSAKKPTLKKAAKTVKHSKKKISFV